MKELNMAPLLVRSKKYLRDGVENKTSQPGWCPMHVLSSLNNGQLINQIYTQIDRYTQPLVGPMYKNVKL